MSLAKVAMKKSVSEGSEGLPGTGLSNSPVEAGRPTQKSVHPQPTILHYLPDPDSGKRSQYCYIGDLVVISGRIESVG